MIEADEYMTCPHTDSTPRFLYLKPYITIVTNIEHDHPDRYKTIAETKDVFIKLLKMTAQDGLIVANADNEHVKNIISNLRYNAELVTYGENSSSNLQIQNFTSENGFISWNLTNNFDQRSIRLWREKSKIQNLKLCIPVPGKHNAQNATGVFAVARHIGLSPDEICKHLCGFRGLKRRFELKGEKDGIDLVPYP